MAASLYYAMNLNMTLDFKPEVKIWSKLRMRILKIAKIGEKQHQTAYNF